MLSGGTGDFTRSLACLVEPALAGLDGRLDAIAGLSGAERAAIRAGVAAALRETALRKAGRTLILELNAARVTGRLSAGDPAARFEQFLALSSSPAYWDSLGEHYPTLLPRLRTVLARRCAAAADLARRLAADRSELTTLAGGDPGPLTGVRFGVGDSHLGGRSVAILSFERGRTVVYKPRPVQVDAVLSRLLRELFGADGGGTAIRVPAVIAGRDPGADSAAYGWAEYIDHRYCAGDAEFAAFYRGIGAWLAVMRLLGGSDLHAENVIACGPAPIVVDCETLFSPQLPARASGLGLAVDHATDLVTQTVLRTGMLPLRGTALGWRGVDSSAVGALPGQQPVFTTPTVVDFGTDAARVGFAVPGAGRIPVRACHPSPEPVLARHWERIIEGFDDADTVLRKADRDGRLDALLGSFAHCPVRVVLRGTEVYAEVGRMLWHPVSLHDQKAATKRAADLLAAMAQSQAGAPDDPRIVEAEIDDLLHDDVPYFSTTPQLGRLAGPAGTSWLEPRDLVADALARWRAADLDLDRAVIRAALVSAYLNDDQPIHNDRMVSGRAARAGSESGHTRVPAGSLEPRRRALAADLLRRLRDAAIRGPDGTATWIAPALGQTGWAVRPLGPDLYSGLAGVALLVAAYQRECARGQATPVAGLDEIFDATLRTLRAAEDFVPPGSALAEPRPPAPGGYIGIGSQIRVWLTLHRWGVDGSGSDCIYRARALAGLLPTALAATDEAELLAGRAGAIVPLLRLAAATGETQWTEQAVAIGAQVVAAARAQERGGVSWPTDRWPLGLGGCAHGATGIGWALARLALATGEGSGPGSGPGSRTRPGPGPGTAPFGATAAEAFAFEQTLYDPALGSWLDLRHDGQAAAAWCHGAVGIGLCAADLGRRGWPLPAGLLRRAADAADRFGMGWNHTLCHGDAGCWELLAAALDAGCAPPGLTRGALDARFIESLEAHGAISGLARDAFSPGLMSGLGGVAYQLLRMREGSDLPSVLMLGDAG